MIKISADPLSSQTPQVTEARWASPIAGCVRAFLLAFCLLLPARAVERVALVIGNQAYQHANPLRNPGNDARAVAEALKKANFTVIQGADLGNQALSGKVEEFRLAARGASAAFFYFSGHGLESKGLNYLVPVDADLTAEYQIKAQTLGVEQVLGAMDEAGVKLKMVVLDCCRNNPFKGWRTTRGGLAAPQEMPSGTVMMFAAASGNVAQDGKGANSPFASALVKALQTPGLDYVKVFKNTGASVTNETGGQQTPWMNFSYYGDFYFLPGVPNAPLPAQPIPTPVVSVKEAPPQAGEPWENSLGMKFVPAGTEGVLWGVWDVRVQDFKAFVKEAGYDATGGMYSLGKDGLKQGGATWEKPGFRQGPTHPVVGVSWNDAKAFCSWLTEKERGSGKLGEGQSYRLPTDHEWSVAVGIGDQEDAAQTPQEKDAKIKGVYPWGTTWPPPLGAGNYAGTEANDGDWPSDFKTIEGYTDGYARTSPVGSFRANRYGLYDLGGNVWQWCEDYYDGKSGSRVLRGGSWSLSDPEVLLSSFRIDCGAPGIRGTIVGFRVVVVVER